MCTTPEDSVIPVLGPSQFRAQVVLRAADGIEDVQIATELSMRRKDVLHWRKRFQAEGIRGLWDVPGAGPKQRISPEKERAVVWDVLYGASGIVWNAKMLAQKYGLSRPAVYRIFEKYGIVRGKHGLVEMEPLKIFLDPLFGVTVSGIAGLYYGTSGALALTSTRRPFSELCFSTINIDGLKALNEFRDELRKLAELRNLMDQHRFAEVFGALPRQDLAG